MLRVCDHFLSLHFMISAAIAQAELSVPNQMYSVGTAIVFAAGLACFLTEGSPEASVLWSVERSAARALQSASGVARRFLPACSCGFGCGCGRADFAVGLLGTTAALLGAWFASAGGRPAETKLACLLEHPSHLLEAQQGVDKKAQKWPVMCDVDGFV